MCFETGDRRNAEQYYTKAVQLNPRDYISLKRRAILLEQRGDDEAAIADVKKSLAIRPNDAEAYVILGNIVAMYDIEDVDYEDDNVPEEGTEDPVTEAEEKELQKALKQRRQEKQPRRKSVRTGILQRKSGMKANRAMLWRNLRKASDRIGNAERRRRKSSGSAG